jgi:predicted RNA-binding Zn-ribbon protein involved in translation (DUF1610 family)
MSLKVTCSRCQRRTSVEERLVGTRIECPECGDTFPATLAGRDRKSEDLGADDPSSPAIGSALGRYCLSALKTTAATALLLLVVAVCPPIVLHLAFAIFHRRKKKERSGPT